MRHQRHRRYCSKQFAVSEVQAPRADGKIVLPDSDTMSQERHKFTHQTSVDNP
jgi:hypothetical protein